MKKRQFINVLTLAALTLGGLVIVGCDNNQNNNQVLEKSISIDFINGDELKNSYINNFKEHEEIKSFVGEKFNKEISFSEGIDLSKIKITNNEEIINFKIDESSRKLTFDISNFKSNNNIKIDLSEAQVKMIDFSISKDIVGDFQFAPIIDETKLISSKRIKPNLIDIKDIYGDKKFQIPVGKRFFFLSKNSNINSEIGFLNDSSLTSFLEIVKDPNDIKSNYKYNGFDVYLGEKQNNFNLNREIKCSTRLDQYDYTNYPNTILFEIRPSKLVGSMVYIVNDEVEDKRVNTENGENHFEYTYKDEIYDLAYPSSYTEEELLGSATMFYLGNAKFATQDETLKHFIPEPYSISAEDFGKNLFLVLQKIDNSPVDLNDLEFNIYDSITHKLLDSYSIKDFELNKKNNKEYLLKISQEKLNSYSKTQYRDGLTYKRGSVYLETNLKETIRDKFSKFTISSKKGYEGPHRIDFLNDNGDFGKFYTTSHEENGDVYYLVDKEKWSSTRKILFSLGKPFPKPFYDDVYISADILVNDVEVLSYYFDEYDYNSKQIGVDISNNILESDEYHIEINYIREIRSTNKVLDCSKLDLSNFDVYISQFYPESNEDFKKVTNDTKFNVNLDSLLFYYMVPKSEEKADKLLRITANGNHNIEVQETGTYTDLINCPFKTSNGYIIKHLCLNKTLNYNNDIPLTIEIK